MKSRITIEVDFDNGNMPVIQILATNSDDVRDRLLSEFLKKLNKTSSWCRIDYLSEISEGLGTPHSVFRWLISPIAPSKMTEEIKLMKAVIFSNSPIPTEDNLILDLKKINAAYIAAVELGKCPDSTKYEKISHLFEGVLPEVDVKKALRENQGLSPVELGNKISELIKNLSHVEPQVSISEQMKEIWK